MPKQTPLGVETLQRDAAALFSFVDSICQHCYQGSESPAYLKPSVEFFEYIRGLGDATKAYLNTFPPNAPRDPRLYQGYRQKIETIRYAWFELHQLIKPAVDADTLNVPYTLVEALTKRLNQIRNLEQALGHEFQEVPSNNLDWSKDRLASWAEELFCDLFALWLIGPCYTLAYVELFGLTTILDPADPTGFSAPAGSINFNRSHPADLFRIKQHVLLLEKLQWWDEVDTIKSHYVDVLRSATTIKETDLQFQTTEQNYAAETLQAFLMFAPGLTDLLSDVIKDSAGNDLDSGVAGYKKFGGLIGQYLGKAVVPSVVFDGKQHWYPDTVALLNASMKFYLESLEELMSGIEGQKTLLAGHRSRWINRVEALTGKGIEDHHLLVAEKGAVQDGGSFKRADLKAPEFTTH